MATADIKKSPPVTVCEDLDGVIPKSGFPVRAGKPIVLTALRYNKIVNNATTTERMKALSEAEEEQWNKEQLRVGNEQLVAEFKGNIQRTQAEKLQEIQEQTDKKTTQAIADYEQTKENEAQKRQEKIAKAQQMMERLKPGPRELHSAVLQSEVLRARNVQRNINEEFDKAVKKQEFENKKSCEAQANSWISEEQQRLAEKQKSALAYKQELLKTINENQNRRSEQRKQMIKDQQAAREATDIEIKAQIEKEKALMEKKRAAMRKNALEAMKMVEQRRMRDRMVEEVEDRLCCVYNTGKRQMDALRTEQTKKLVADQQKKIEDEVKKLSNNEAKVIAVENERIRRDISTMQLKFTAEEQEKVRKDKAAKQARIEAHLKEMEMQKEAKRRFDEEKRFDMAQRFKNTEIDQKFYEAKKQDHIRQQQNVRKHLDQQMDEKKRNQLAQKQAVVKCKDDTVDKDHSFFFDYARNLMEDSQQKGRPLYPFVKVVQQYKRDNQIEYDRKIPKHLESKVPIGEKSKGNTQPGKATDASLTASSKVKDDKNSTKKSILQNCLKINEIIKTEKETLNNTQILPPNTFEECNIASGGKPLEQITIKDDCAASLSPSTSYSAKLRYSMQELKNMNQFAAPTCH